MIIKTQNALATFLVVDDDPIGLDLVRLTLGRLGFNNIQTAIDGELGLRELDGMQAPPDFIISDIFMPAKDGIELTEELAKRQYKGGIILISSGDPRILSLAQELALEAGLNVLGAFIKPLRLESLKFALFSRYSSLG